MLPSRRTVAFYVGAIGSALFMVRLLGASWSTHFPAVWPDAVYPKQGYLAVAGEGAVPAELLLRVPADRVPAPALGAPAQLDRHRGRADRALLRRDHRPVRDRASGPALTDHRGVAAFAFVGIAIQAKYAMWNVQILSESLAISLGFAAIAAWWRFAAAPTRPRARWGWAFMIAWLLVRDAHVLPATIVIVPVALAVAGFAKRLGPGVRRSLAVGAVVVVAAAGYSYFVGERIAPRGVVVPRRRRDPRAPRCAADEVVRSARDAARRRVAHAHRQRRPRRRLLPLEGSRLREVPALGARRGPAALVLSLVVLAPHYASLMNKDLPAILRGDVREYDTQGVYDRLPHQIPLPARRPDHSYRASTIWLVPRGARASSPRSCSALRRKRGLGLVVFGATALLLTLVEGYTTWGGDPVELERHMIGALSRLSVILVIVIASSLDAAIIAAALAAGRDGRRRSRPMRRRGAPERHRGRALADRVRVDARRRGHADRQPRSRPRPTTPCSRRVS